MLFRSSDVLDEWIEEQVLENEAKRRGVDVETLLAAETAPITQEEVQAFFDQNAARLPAGTTLADVEEPIRQHLEERKRGEAIAALVNRAGVQVHLDPPRLEVAAVGPSLGPEDAPITIIEFGDFQCPYCRRAAPIMKQLRERYPERLRFVYRHLPLESIHPRARAAAEASICADAQDRFWAFHDRVYSAPGGLGDAELRAHAEAVGVDLESFDACLSEGAEPERIAGDIQAARDAGISGTPAFVVNGVLVTGAQPIEVFDELIQSELSATGSTP